MLVPPEMHRPRSDWEDRKGDTSNAIYMQLLLGKKKYKFWVNNLQINFYIFIYKFMLISIVMAKVV